MDSNSGRSADSWARASCGSRALGAKRLEGFTVNSVIFSPKLASMGLNDRARTAEYKPMPFFFVVRKSVKDSFRWGSRKGLAMV